MKRSGTLDGEMGPPVGVRRQGPVEPPGRLGETVDLDDEDRRLTVGDQGRDVDPKHAPVVPGQGTADLRRGDAGDPLAGGELGGSGGKGSGLGDDDRQKALGPRRRSMGRVEHEGGATRGQAAGKGGEGEHGLETGRAAQGEPRLPGSAPPGRADGWDARPVPGLEEPGPRERRSIEDRASSIRAADPTVGTIRGGQGTPSGPLRHRGRSGAAAGRRRRGGQPEEQSKPGGAQGRRGSGGARGKPSRRGDLRRRAVDGRMLAARPGGRRGEKGEAMWDRHHAPVAAALLGLLVACEGSRDDEIHQEPSEAVATGEAAASGAGGAAGSSERAGEESAQDAPPGPTAQGDGYALEARLAGPYSAGQLASFAIALEAREQWHLNQDYPTKVTVQGPGTVAFPRAELAKGDAASWGEDAARFDVPFTPSETGEHPVQATVKFAICTEETCIPTERTLALKLPVE